MSEPWDLVAAERHGIADLFESLDDDQMAVASLCHGWTVRHLLAHLTMGLTYSAPEMAAAFVRAGGRLPRAISAVTLKRAERSTEYLVGVLRDKADHRFTPPTYGVEAPLTDLYVHGVDARHPLGLGHAADPSGLQFCLDFTVSPKAARGGFTRRGTTKNLRFEASDLDWSHGTGPLVRGPGLNVLAALCSRVAVLDTLEGDGLATLRARLT